MERPCALVCFVCVCFGLECAARSEVVVRCSVHRRYPPDFSKLVIRKARGSEKEKKESRWRPLFFNEIFDIFSFCFERRGKGDGEAGKRRVEYKNGDDFLQIESLCGVAELWILVICLGN